MTLRCSNPLSHMVRVACQHQPLLHNCRHCRRRSVDATKLRRRNRRTLHHIHQPSVDLTKRGWAGCPRKVADFKARAVELQRDVDGIGVGVLKHANVGRVQAVGRPTRGRKRALVAQQLNHFLKGIDQSDTVCWSVLNARDVHCGSGRLARVGIRLVTQSSRQTDCFVHCSRAIVRRVKNQRPPA